MLKTEEVLSWVRAVIHLAQYFICDGNVRGAVEGKHASLTMPFYAPSASLSLWIKGGTG